MVVYKANILQDYKFVLNYQHKISEPVMTDKSIFILFFFFDWTAPNKIDLIEPYVK